MSKEHFEKAAKKRQLMKAIHRTVLELEKFCIKNLDGHLRYQFILKLENSMRIVEYSKDHSMTAAEECGVEYNLPERWFVVKPDAMQSMYYSIDCFVEELYKLHKLNIFRIAMIEKFILERV